MKHCDLVFGEFFKSDKDNGDLLNSLQIQQLRNQYHMYIFGLIFRPRLKCFKNGEND